MRVGVTGCCSIDGSMDGCAKQRGGIKARDRREGGGEVVDEYTL